MDNKKITIIILSIITVSLSIYITYDKINEKNIATNDNNEIKENNNNKTEDNTKKEQYNYDDFLGTVFSSTDGNNYLILWDNGTYSYQNTIGNFMIEDNKLILSSIIKNREIISEKEIKELKINSLLEISDNNLILNKTNQPTSSGGEDFYSHLKSYLDNKTEQ